MQDFDIQQMIGPSVLMPGVEIEVDEAIRVAEERFPGRSLCVVAEWVWLDLEAPDLVNDELASEGKQPVMLLVFQVLFDSSTSSKAHWFRTTPLIEFSDGMFFQTENKLYVLVGHGRRKSMSLSAVIRLF
ncbi:DUF6957 family protein [Pseudomonas syringae]|uniref:DUF6957 domain-containing protein n=1 Tax=Pseudomonas syringae pv. pisi str. 1704B TaxID=629263 RepID=F3G6X5_PSESJ|nr:hypothetical protein [Pseudomonas syringae]EGH42825.1 hypothetical protein PSYPI_10620 [Pseudomonas syringae pv. pisi str. 1704B]PYD08969.1 hypothetical protein DND62_24440 [Pseudomonas syringae pv. pisi]PYD24491.1 hypothetical protein DND58_27725 [Pseudomonas syringae pv. pisi]PYD32336.1 hypothetical protein DND67_14330 [Pseudomonas syringae pv. pisi]RMV63413.1 hypothetical protein ALP08_00828 [Pseudomonas syringae pv. pisi]